MSIEMQGMENTQNIGDYLAILRRRRTLLLGVFFFSKFKDKMCTTTL